MQVALYMSDHSYDLAWYLKQNWSKIGLQLKGKIHVFVGDMDNFYLNIAVYMLEDYLKTTDAAATFDYGRPMKGHGYTPRTSAEMIPLMAAQVEKNRWH